MGGFVELFGDGAGVAGLGAVENGEEVVAIEFGLGGGWGALSGEAGEVAAEPALLLCVERIGELVQLGDDLGIETLGCSGIGIGCCHVFSLLKNVGSRYNFLPV